MRETKTYIMLEDTQEQPLDRKNCAMGAYNRGKERFILTV